MRYPFRTLSHFLSSSSIVSAFGKRIVLPFYHLVSDNQPEHVKHLYRVLSEKEFEDDLDYFLRYFKPLDSLSLIEHLNGNLKLDKPGFYLSFDDGFREVKDIIAPILLRKGIPATFFVNPAYTDNADLMYRCKISLIIERIKTSKLTNLQVKEISRSLIVDEKIESIAKALLELNHKSTQQINLIAEILGIDFKVYLSEKQPYLALNDLKKLNELGFTIGGHGYNHPYFNQISYHEQNEEIERCVNWLKDNFQKQPRLFAFPFSDYGVSEDLIKNITCLPNNLCDLSFGTSGIQPVRFGKHLQRLPMEEQFFNRRQLVEGEILYYLAKNTIGYYKKS